MPPEFDFRGALTALMEGRRVERSKWNGKGMYIAVQPGYPEGVPCNANTAKVMGIKEGTPVKISPYIVMKTVDGDLIPWTASQTDILACDWSIVE